MTPDIEVDDSLALIAEASNNGNQDFLVWDGEAIVGGYGLFPSMYLDGDAWVSYWRDQDRPPNGSMTRSLPELARHAFDSGIDRLLVELAADDATSQRLFESAGFRVAVMDQDAQTRMLELPRQAFFHEDGYHSRPVRVYLN